MSVEANRPHRGSHPIAIPIPSRRTSASALQALPFQTPSSSSSSASSSSRLAALHVDQTPPPFQLTPMGPTPVPKSLPSSGRTEDDEVEGQPQRLCFDERILETSPSNGHGCKRRSPCLSSSDGGLPTLPLGLA